MLPIKIIYLANIVVAGYIAVCSIGFPKNAAITIFSNAYGETDVIRLVGCLWLGIALLSLLGLWKPQTFAAVLLLQLCYKGTWLLAVALPAVLNETPYPKGMASFFLVWCMVLPFVIPWTTWFESGS